MEIKEKEIKFFSVSNSLFFLLIAYVSGIIFWYQYNNSFLFLVLPFVPLAYFVKIRRIKITFALIFVFLMGNITPSFNPEPFKGVIKTEGVVLSIPRDFGYYKKCLIKVESDGVDRLFDTYVDRNAGFALFDRILLEGEVRKQTGYKNFNNSPRFVKNYEEQRVSLKLKRFAVTDSNPFFSRLNQLRERLKESLLKFNGPGRIFLAEILFGEKLMPKKDRDLFVSSGVAHLLSISGLHFAMTVFFAFQVVLFLHKIFPKITNLLPRQELIFLVSLPLLLFYAFISGLSIPAVRAFFVFMLLIFFVFMNRKPATLSLVSLVALILLFFDPALIFSKSFQLSFLAVFVLIFSVPRINDLAVFLKVRDRKIWFYFFSLLTTSVLISLFIFPLTQEMSPQSIAAAVIANPVAIPIVSFLILPVSLISLPLSFFSERLFFALLTVPDFGWRLLKGFLTFVKPVADITVLNISFSFFSALIYLFLLFMLVVLKGKKRLLILFFLFLLLIFQPFDKKLKNGFITFLDVGQGDCAIINTDKGKKIFIDTGGNSYDPNLFNRAYRPFLSMLKTVEIDAVILSHHHPDHYRALEDLLKFYSIKKLYISENDDLTFITGLREIYDFQLKPVLRDTSFKIDEVTFTLYPQKQHRSENDRSLWVMVEKDGYRFLFTGDAEKKALKGMLKRELDLKCFAVKVPHHGAKSSFEESFYKICSPRIAVISVGKNNPWKLPSREVMDFFRKNRITSLRTDQNGQILFSFENGRLSLQTYH